MVVLLYLGMQLTTVSLDIHKTIQSTETLFLIGNLVQEWRTFL